jgi:hypothetical protein
VKKEEFPTFLNEQPTIIFGRTGRELLIIACGLFFGYETWDTISSLLPDFAGIFLGMLLTGIVVTAFLVLALVKVGYRHLEEWIFAWLLFIGTPKVYMYKPWQDETEYQMEAERSRRMQKGSNKDRDRDDLNDDLEDN